MQYRNLFIIAIVAVASMLSSGCAGLKLWQKGRHFQTSLDPAYAPDSVSKVAVYVFSEGEPIDGKDIPVDALDVIGSILMLPIKLLSGDFSFGGTQIGLHQSFFPHKVATDLTMEPDMSNAGPSLELANNIREHLAEKGYPATVISTIEHKGEIPMSQVLAHARSEGYDAAFVVYYAGLKSWTEYAGTEVYTRGRTTVTQTNVNVYNGFLFLPNAGLFDVNTGKMMWSYSNYGIVQKAHTPNISGEPFVVVSSESLVKKGGDDYFVAAKNAAKLMFDPEHWPQSYIDLPSRGDGKRRM